MKNSRGPGVLLFRVFYLNLLFNGVFLPGVMASSQPAGVVQEVSGQVNAADASGSSRALSLRDEVFAGDQLSAAESSHVVIRLSDGSVLTLGSGSALVLDEFVFDPATRGGNSLTSVFRGVVRLTSGALVRKNPDSMKIKLPAGSLAVRGTTLAVDVQDENTLVVLLATLDPLTGELKESGHVTVQNSVEGVLKETFLVQAGYGSLIEGRGKAPSESFLVPEERIEKINQTLRGGGSSASSSRAAQVFGGYEAEASAEKNRVLYRKREDPEPFESEDHDQTLTEEAQVLEESASSNKAQVSTDFSR